MVSIGKQRCIGCYGVLEWPKYSKTAWENEIISREQYINNMHILKFKKEKAIVSNFTYNNYSVCCHNILKLKHLFL